LGRSHVLEFLFGHGVHHLLGGPLEVLLGRVAALGRKGRAGGLLLGFGSGRHFAYLPETRVREKTKPPGKEFRRGLTGDTAYALSPGLSLSPNRRFSSGRSRRVMARTKTVASTAMEKNPAPEA